MTPHPYRSISPSFTTTPRLSHVVWKVGGRKVSKHDLRQNPTYTRPQIYPPFETFCNYLHFLDVPMVPQDSHAMFGQPWRGHLQPYALLPGCPCFYYCVRGQTHPPGGLIDCHRWLFFIYAGVNCYLFHYHERSVRMWPTYRGKGWMCAKQRGRFTPSPLLPRCHPAPSPPPDFKTIHTVTLLNSHHCVFLCKNPLL